MKPCYIVQRARADAILYLRSARSWCKVESGSGVGWRKSFDLKVHHRPTVVSNKSCSQQHPNKCWRGQASRGHLATVIQNCLLLKACAAEAAWCKNWLAPQLLGVNRLANQAFGSCQRSFVEKCSAQKAPGGEIPLAQTLLCGCWCQCLLEGVFSWTSHNFWSAYKSAVNIFVVEQALGV